MVILTYNLKKSSKIIYLENYLVSRAQPFFGIDISHYNGDIKWQQLNQSKHKINYIFIRATMGIDGVDKKYKTNWKKAKDNNYLRGAYHYYRPNENSTKQFENYAKHVKLKKGDFYPVLDIEQTGTIPNANLLKGLKNWLQLAEEYYGVKPIVYTGSWFYENYLIDELQDYPLWIANYSGSKDIKHINWQFHQFTDKMIVRGIPSKVDGNRYRGSKNNLKKYIMSF